MSAGYSGTPLPKKLGLKPKHRLCLLSAPDDFLATLGALPEDITVSGRLMGGAPHDVIVMFVTARSDLERRFGAAAERLHKAGGLWIAWPKKASRVPTDVTEDVVREVALGAGLVDNKVCAIDAIWSGLRCVYRLKDR
jgi:hypothetical protein